MAQTDSIRLMIVAMRSREDVMGLAAETLNKMFEKRNTELVAQVSFRCMLLLVNIYKCKCKASGDYINARFV